MSNMNMELLLCEVLSCGTSDLSVIEGCEYDISDILEGVAEFTEKIDLGSIVFAITSIAKSKIYQAVQEKLEKEKTELNELLEEDSPNSSDVENAHIVIADLEDLEPYEDFELWFNYLDTHVSVIKNKEIYKELLKQEVENIFDESGLSFNF